MLGQHSTSTPTLQVFVTCLKKIPSRLKFASSVIAKMSCVLEESSKKFKVIEYKALRSKTKGVAN